MHVMLPKLELLKRLASRIVTLHKSEELVQRQPDMDGGLQPIRSCSTCCVLIVPNCRRGGWSAGVLELDVDVVM